MTRRLFPLKFVLQKDMGDFLLVLNNFFLGDVTIRFQNTSPLKFYRHVLHTLSKLFPSLSLTVLHICISYSALLRIRCDHQNSLKTIYLKANRHQSPITQSIHQPKKFKTCLTSSSCKEKVKENFLIKLENHRKLTCVTNAARCKNTRTLTPPPPPYNTGHKM